MKLIVTFPELTSVVEKMGAPDVRWDPDSVLPDFEDIRRELEEGVDVSLEDLELRGGLLTLKGQQVLLYIKDHRFRDDVLTDPERGNRFHVADCRTLQEMRAKNRFQRYVATERRSGKFKIDCKDINDHVYETESTLLVCKNCLTLLDYNNYSLNRSAVWDAFDLDEFFGMYATFFPYRPTRMDEIAIPEQYVKDWSPLSRYVRENQNWTCEKCGITLDGAAERKWLHTHHKNGRPSDNRMANLEALCIECHAGSHPKGWIKVPPEAAALIRKKREDMQD